MGSNIRYVIEAMIASHMEIPTMELSSGNLRIFLQWSRTFLHKPVRPALQLLAHEVEIVGLERVANSFWNKANFVANLIEAPGQVHVFRPGTFRPATNLLQLVSVVGRKAT